MMRSIDLFAKKYFVSNNYHMGENKSPYFKLIPIVIVNYNEKVK